MAGIAVYSAAQDTSSVIIPQYRGGPPTVMEEVVVTASRSAADALSTPAVVETLSRDFMERKLTRTVPEALKEIPGVAVQKTANGQGSPIIRGFTGYRTLALIDGIRYNHSAYRDGPNEYFSLIDPLSLDRLELVQGPGSVLYGSDAAGGVLNVFTRGTLFSEMAPGQAFGQGAVFSRWHSAEQSWLGRAEYDLGVGNEWGLHLGGTWKDFGDVIAAEIGEQRFTGYAQRSYDARLDVRLDDRWEMTLAHHALWQDDAWRTHATVYGRSFAGTETGTDLRRVADHGRTLSYARLRGVDLGGWADTAQLTVSYQTLDEELDRVRSAGERELSHMDIGTLGFDIQLTSQVPGGKLTWGADYFLDRVDTSRSDFDPDGSLKKIRIQGPVGDDARYRLLGVYAQHEMPLGDRGTALIAGARCTYAGASAGRYEDPLGGGVASLSEDWHNGVGSVRLTQELNRDGTWVAYGGVSQAFRAPNLGDLTRLGASRSDEIESAAVGLKPERFMNYEVGLKHRGEKLGFNLAVFHTELEDYITSTPTGRIVDGQREVTKKNSSEGFVQGVQGDLEWGFSKQWTIFGGISWTEGEADFFNGQSRRGEPLSRIPPLNGHYGIRWKSVDGKCWAELQGLSAAKADRLNSSDAGDSQRIPPGGTPGYTVLNLRAGWQASENITVFVGLDNLLDEAYRVHGSGSNEPGFGGTIGLKVVF
jgi:hemoglobin/transferrin/lactoferrin receptor protein